LTKSHFLPGQRWVSNTEPEAGLGIVVERAHRRVTVTFPAIAEQRVYAIDNAPLSRVHYSEGDIIRRDDGVELTVTAIHEESGRLVYQASDDNGDEQSVDELDLDSFIQFSKPQDRLFSGQIDSPARSALRRETLDHLRRLQQSATQGLQGARAQLLPHQFYIASEVASRHAPRVLLADEVGLGKTIEAGLIIHQQLISGRASRVLIVVPDSLIHQWLVEMLRRFNLRFAILDEERCQALTTPDNVDSLDDEDDITASDEDFAANPFESAQLVLCNLSFLVNHPNRHQQACDAGWDLMVVDEAHHLRWSEEQASAEYRCIETLAARVKGLLLLTATPEQLGIESHFARLKLLDPARYHDLQQFREEESGYRNVSELVEALLAEDAPQQLRDAPRLLAELQQYLGEAGTAVLQKALQGDQNPAAIATAISDLIRNLLDRHGTGRVLFRNTRDAVAGFPERQFNAYPLPPPARYTSTLEGLGEIISPSLQERLHPETLLGDNWLTSDPRVAWLCDWLDGLKDDQGRAEKALVICARASTAKALEDYLNLRQGFRTALFHEGMTLVERDRAAAYFADDEESAQVLVCSEIGSEGRNFQFARHLVLFDLPLNPDLLEQRIGRLDRIGQRHTVQIHVPHYDSGAQVVLVRWYHEGLNAFERVCPVGAAIHEQVGEALRQCLLQAENEDAVEQLLADTCDLTEAAIQRLQQGRDRLLELSSCDPVRAEHIIDAIAESESPHQLADYMARVFDQFGVDHSDHSANAIIVAPGDHMQCESFPALLEDGMTVTYSRDKALSREDIHFLSWEHPMVSGAMDMIIGGEFGNATLCTLKLPPLKPATLLLETFYTLHCPAPRHLQLHRFLPATTLRVVVDVNGKDLTDILTTAHLDKLGQKVAKGTAQDVVRHTRPQITAMIKQAEELLPQKSLQGERGDLVATAIAAMEQSQNRELQRLMALAQVNPNIRQDEIDHIVATTAALKHHMEKAEWRLDSLRVAITV